MFYEKLFHELQEHGIKYLVVGGLAVNLHGVPRMTADVDIAIAFDKVNVNALVSLLGGLGYKTKAPVNPMFLADQNKRSRWQKEKHMRAFTFMNQINPLEEVDIMLHPPFDFDQAYERRDTVVAASININLASIDDLIATKQKTGRSQDDSDIAALMRIKELELEPPDGD